MIKNFSTYLHHDDTLAAMIKAERENDKYNALLIKYGAYNRSYVDMTRRRVVGAYLSGHELKTWVVY